MNKDTAIEVRQIDGHIELYLITNLNGSFVADTREGIKIINPIEGFNLMENLNDKFHWVDRNDFLVQWENAKGERAASFADVALMDEQSQEYDAWTVAEVILKKRSDVVSSTI